MPFDPTETIEIPRASDGSVEQLRPFIPTPNRLAQLLERSEKEVLVQLESAQGRQDIVKELLDNADALRKMHADFRPELLQEQVDEVVELLGANERYLKDMQSPEKKSMFRRAWESVKGFPRKHPVVTALAALAILTGGIAGGLYLAGYFQMAQAGVAAEVVKDFLEGSDVVNRGIGDMTDFNPYHGVPPGH